MKDVAYPTFHEAACARGLLDSNVLWEQMIADAAREYMGHRRFAFFFAGTIVHGQPPDPVGIFEKFFDKLLLPPSRGTETDLQKEARKEKILRRLEYYFRLMGKSCADVGLPAPSNYDHETMEKAIADEITAERSNVSHLQ